MNIAVRTKMKVTLEQLAFGVVLLAFLTATCGEIVKCAEDVL